MLQIYYTSQLDIDRMDYLLRDSYYVGVKYILAPIFRNEKLDIEEYIRLNDSVILYVVLLWKDSTDGILRDLCCKYLYRDLYKAYEFKQFVPNIL